MFIKNVSLALVLLAAFIGVLPGLLRGASASQAQDLLTASMVLKVSQSLGLDREQTRKITPVIDAYIKQVQSILMEKRSSSEQKRLLAAAERSLEAQLRPYLNNAQGGQSSALLGKPQNILHGGDVLRSGTSGPSGSGIY